MKATITHTICCFLLLSFAAACGKKESASGSKNPPPPVVNNPINVPAVTAGEVAYNALTAWVEKADDTQVGLHGAYLKETLKTNLYVTPVMCQKSLFGIPGCTQPSGCFKVTSNGIMKGVVKMIGSDEKRYSDCDVSVINPYIKSADQELREAVYGKPGLHVIKSLTQKTNSVYKIFYGALEGSTTPIATGEVNTSLPAIVNPTIAPISTTQHKRLVDYIVFQ